jgi:hypothetical protein
MLSSRSVTPNWHGVMGRQGNLPSLGRLVNYFRQMRHAARFLAKILLGCGLFALLVNRQRL